MLGTQLNPLVGEEPGKISIRCLIRLEEFICNMVHDRQIAIILGVSVVAPPLATLVGNPVNLDNKAPAATAAPAQQAQYQKPTPQAQAYMQPQQQYIQQPAAPRGPPAAASFQQQQQRAPAGAMVGDANLFPISALNPYQNQRWMVKARVTHKGDIKEWKNDRGAGKLMNIEILDADGGKMRVCMFGEAVDMFEPIIQQGRTYFISKGQIKPSNKKFNPNGGDYEMTLDKNSTVVPTEDDKIPMQAYNFVPIIDIQNIDADKVIDVIGKVINVGDIQQINTKRGAQLAKRNITLVDSTMASIELTLWGKFAETFNTDDILAAQGVKVSEWGARTLSTTFQSQLESNPDIPACHKLRAWYNANAGSLANVVQLTQAGVRPSGQQGEGGKEFKTTPYKTFKQVRDENIGRTGDADFYMVVATVSAIKHEKDVWYNACSQCKKKVTEASGAGGWMCEKCNQTFPSCDRRYILRATSCDHTGSEWINAFNEHGETIMGVSAQQVQQWKEAADPQYEAAFDSALFKEFVFKIRAKQDTWQEQVRVQHTVIGVTPMDYAAQTKRLQELIQRYQQMGYAPSIPGL